MEWSIVQRFQLLLLSCYIAAAVLLWPSLPERLPIHFDMSGEPTDWVSTGILSWFGLPMLAAGITFFLYWIGEVASRKPELWNVPEKKRFLALSANARAPIEKELRKPLDWSAPLVTIMFIGIHIEIYRTATEGSSGQTWLTLLSVVVPVTIILWLAFRSASTAGRWIREASAAEEAGGEV